MEEGRIGTSGGRNKRDQWTRKEEGRGRRGDGGDGGKGGSVQGRTAAVLQRRQRMTVATVSNISCSKAIPCSRKEEGTWWIAPWGTVPLIKLHMGRSQVPLILFAFLSFR